MLQLIYNFYRNLEDNVIFEVTSLSYNSFVVNKLELCRSTITYVKVLDILLTL